MALEILRRAHWLKLQNFRKNVVSLSSRSSSPRLSLAPEDKRTTILRFICGYISPKDDMT